MDMLKYINEGEALACHDLHWTGMEDFQNYTFVKADLPILEKILKYGGLIFKIDEWVGTSYNRIGYKMMESR